MAGQFDTVPGTEIGVDLLNQLVSQVSKRVDFLAEVGLGEGVRHHAFRDEHVGGAKVGGARALETGHVPGVEQFHVVDGHDEGALVRGAIGPPGDLAVVVDHETTAGYVVRVV